MSGSRDELGLQSTLTCPRQQLRQLSSGDDIGSTPSTYDREQASQPAKHLRIGRGMLDLLNGAQYSQDSQGGGVIIAVIGKSGCGKSSFISKLAMEYTPENNPEYEAHSIREVEAMVRGRMLLMIDTPGFDVVAGKDMVTILESIRDWLQHSFNNPQRLSGLVYVHDIKDPQVGRSSVKAFKLLREVTGQENMSKVILLTTKWDDLGNQDSEGGDLETELHENSNFWKGMIADGATVMRHDNTTSSAEKAVLRLLDNAPIVPNALKRAARSHPFERPDGGACAIEGLIRYRQHIEALSRRLERALCKNNAILAIQLRQHHEKIIDGLNGIQKLYYGCEGPVSSLTY